MTGCRKTRPGAPEILDIAMAGMSDTVLSADEYKALYQAQQDAMKA